MASTINADNGVVSGSSGLKSAADATGVLALQTNGTTAITVDTSQNVTFVGSQTLSAGTANGVTYLNGSKVLTSGTALTFDGTTLSATKLYANATASNATGVGAIQVGPTGMGAASTDGGLEFTSNSGAGGYGGKIWASNTLDALVISGRNASATWTNLLTLRPNVTVALEGASGSTGTGIAFPATQNPSSNANTLDDYEEGTWTPTDASGAGLTLTLNSGSQNYTKIGNIVQLTFYVTYPSTSNGTTASIGGIPFACKTNTFNYGTSRVTGVTNLTPAVQAESSSLKIYYQGSNAYNNIDLSTRSILSSLNYIATA